MWSPDEIILNSSVGEPSTQMTLNTFHLAGESPAVISRVFLIDRAWRG